MIKRTLVPAAVLLAVSAGAAAGSETTAADVGAHQVDTWAAAPTDMAGSYSDKTVRDIVHTSIGGRAVRVRLSNAFGTAPVTFDAVDLGRQASGAALAPGSNHSVTFGGSTSVTVPKGAEVLSDPVPVTVPARTNLAVSLYVSGATGEVTGHPLAQQDNYVANGDAAASTAATSYDKSISRWFFLDGLVVDAPNRAGGIIALGDSITDGAHSTQNANHRWPNYLAARVQRLPAPFQPAVADEGISGNEILADGSGVSAQARLDRDVLAQPGARTVVFLEGINDIGNGIASSADQLIAADKQIIARTHADGLRILGGTLTPFAGAAYYSPQKEAIREALNTWIRTSRAFDGVIDFDKALRDPANPLSTRPAYDSGDHLHPNDLGYQAMANAVNLNTLLNPW